MPVRPRHCNGQLYARSTHATDRGREGERARPGARRRPRPRHVHRSSGEDWWRHGPVRCTSRRVRSGHLLTGGARSCISVSRCSRRASSSRSRAAARGVRARRAACGAASVRRRLRRHARCSVKRRGASSRSTRRPPSCSSRIGAGDRLVGRTHVDRLSGRRARDSGSRPRAAAERRERCSPPVPTSSLLYASDDNRDAARRLRAAGVRDARVPRRSHRRFPARHASRWARSPAIRSRRAPPSIPCARRSSACARPRSAARDPTVFWHAVGLSHSSRSGGGSFLNELLDIAGGTQHLWRPRRIRRRRSRSRISCSAIPTSSSLAPESRARYRRPIRVAGAARGARRTGCSSSTRCSSGRPGPRLGEAAVSLARLLHPGSVP